MKTNAQAKSLVIDQDSPIWKAIAEDNLSKLEELVASGTPLNTESKDGIRPVHYAAKKGALECLKYIIKKGGVSVAELDRFEYQPLHYAAFEGCLNTTEFLVDYGACIEACDLLNKQTPLHMAASWGELAIVKYLVEHKANINARDSHGNQTPLHLAAMEGNTDAASYLIEQGSDIAAYGGYNKQTPLHMTALGGHVSTIKLLLNSAKDKGIDIINLQDIDGNTALHLAFFEAKNEAADCLIENGADITITNSQGVTAVDIAQNAGFLNVLKQAVENPNPYLNESGEGVAPSCLSNDDEADLAGSINEFDHS